MELLKRCLMGLGTILLLALSLQLFAPKTVHAVVSTLVTVANTSSNPVPTTSVKESAANYLTLVFDVPSGTYYQLHPDDTTTQYVLPEGQQFVITDVDWIVGCASAIFSGPTCQKSAGDAVLLTLGQTPYFAGGYTGQATYSSPGFGLFASRSDIFKSGYVVSQLPTPQIFVVAAPGEAIYSVTLRGYLVPAPASAE
jgi:hypothetical protein